MFWRSHHVYITFYTDLSLSFGDRKAVEAQKCVLRTARDNKDHEPAFKPMQITIELFETRHFCFLDNSFQFTIKTKMNT
jgi:hypothetical protein